MSGDTAKRYPPAIPDGKSFVCQPRLFDLGHEERALKIFGPKWSIVNGHKKRVQPELQFQTKIKGW